MKNVNMDNLPEAVKMTYVSAETVLETEEQMHRAEAEIRERMGEMENMTPVERYQFQRKIYAKYLA